jgi:hypothetical protein
MRPTYPLACSAVTYRRNLGRATTRFELADGEWADDHLELSVKAASACLPGSRGGR